MKTHRSVSVSLVIILAILSSEVVSQAPKNSEADRPTDSPLSTVHFKFEIGQLPIALPSLVVAGLPLCGFKDSSLLLQFMRAPDYETQGLYSISSGNDVRTLSVPDPQEPELQRNFREADANESGVYMLTVLTRRTGKNYPKSLEDMTSDPKNYEILRYDDQGQLKETIHHDLHFRPVRFGVFPDGKFLVLGVNDVNETPQAAILNTDGSFVANVDLWNALPSNEKLAASVPNGFSSASTGMKLSIAVGAYQIWHTPSGLALLKQRDTNKIILVTSGGSVSTVTPRIPKGYTVDSFVESDNRWLLRVNGPENADAIAKFDIYEFRSDDGVLVRKLSTEPAPSSGFACEHDGEFRLLHWIDKKPYLETAKPE
jgi:hypothetical protein